MSPSTSDNLEAILAYLSEPNPTLWVSGEFPELRLLASKIVLGMPVDLISTAVQNVEQRTTSEGCAAENVQSMCLVLDARSVAAAAAAEDVWGMLTDLALRGPDVGVHPVFARPGAVEDGLSGSDFALLVRMLDYLLHDVELNPVDIAEADPHYLAVLSALRSPSPARLDALSAEAAGPQYTATTDAAPNRVVAAVRQVVAAAEELWDHGLLDRARAMVTPVVVLVDEASGLSASDWTFSEAGGGKAAAQFHFAVWGLDPKTAS